MVIPAIKSLVPLLLKSARYTPGSKEVEILSRLINRMKVLRSSSSSVHELAVKVVDECKQPHQTINPTVELLKNKWGWDREKLIDVLVALWKELNL
ncbi:hypothetical protein [Parabacteroides pacaensis]|uniref:hypothetical protein n=1 Tax=Parabacteroides pacaensis TaxID=2086575 RepID=UPI000D10BA2D|nr:hypothetical protein [Parabacteroides pacaensis]